MEVLYKKNTYVECEKMWLVGMAACATLKPLPF